ncbi:glycosyltransferase [Roseovarius faecimaris]|uniref:Glycosyltransferase n=1 Tax=Roseovarius faecimaris TaxID=2494550 RepID=A0A6I6IS30_9RHOB|nr:glycosyltransferase family 4 protein [Roseovarius faecimaris]QGX98703.1 glycosyltransferase [Roseovarius faecimaris]
MTDPGRNAAIWYADDGYDPVNKGLNGRRVAGASFLAGFFRHADVAEFVSLTQGRKGQARFAERLAASGRDLPHRAAYVSAPLRMAPVHTLYYPSPNYAEQCWLRQRFGKQTYAISGITHTTATRAVMQGMFDLRAAPQAPWDAVICTSRSVHAATLRNLDLADAQLRARFGALPPRPLMPVIPLGIDCNAYAHDPAARDALRSRMGWGPDDIVIATLSRLLPYGKFDPGPLFLALQAARQELPGRRLHMLACGIYADTHSKNTFEACARALMPDVSYTHLDGADATARRETLSGADIFTFPIDNIQETFGLAPIEAMAAGLPVVTSDWDGMRDTVSEDVGIRVPTLSAPARHTLPEAWRYHCQQQSYAQYSSNVSALTAIDLPALTRAFVALASNPDKRRSMGEAGKRRARTLYDWAAIIPQMQDLWAEQNAMREAADDDKTPRAVPMAPAPMDLFSAYPTAQLTPGRGRIHPQDSSVTLREIYAARRYGKLGQVFEKEETLQMVHDALVAGGAAGSSAATLAKQLGLNPVTVERACLWLIKYGLARYEAPS